MPVLHSTLLGRMAASASTRTSPSSFPEVPALSGISVGLVLKYDVLFDSISIVSVIQLARLAGFSPIITTASPHNTDALKAFGATHVIDRNLPADQIVTEVKKAAGGAPIKTAFDAVSLADTQNIAYDALAPGGTLVIDLPSLIQEEKKVADKRFVQVVGSANAPQNRKVSVALYAKLTGWLADGSIKVCSPSYQRNRLNTDQRESLPSSRPGWKRYQTDWRVSFRGWRGSRREPSAA